MMASLSTNFFLRSRRIRVDLQSYESKTTDKRQQNDWKGGKKLDGLVQYIHCQKKLTLQNKEINYSYN